MTASRALVVGADGQIGAALSVALRTRGVHVVGTTRRRDRVLSRDTIHLDLSEPTEMPPPADVAFICAAVTKLAECRLAPDTARRINCEGPLELARSLASRGTKIVFLSTAAVLDCLAPGMLADRPRAGRSLYGKWKGDAEAGLFEIDATAAVLRLTKVLTPHAILFQTWLQALRRNETVEAFEDMRIAPLRVSDVVDAAIAVGDDNEGGLYQVSGARDVSYFEMARFFAEALGRPEDLVRRCPAGTRGIPPEETLGFTSLDCSRLTALTGFVPPEPFRLARELFLEQNQGTSQASNETTAGRNEP